MRDRTDNGNPRLEIPALSGRVHPHSRTASLTERLQPTVDKIRQLYTDFGERPYRVFLVHQLWSGGVRGRGQPQDISRVEILPVPRVLNMDGTTQVLHAFGLQEDGGIAVDQVSLRFTEDDLLGKTPDLIDPTNQRSGPEGYDFFWEVVEARNTTPQPVRRRYVPNAVPVVLPDGFQWKITLTKQEFNRSRAAGQAGRPGRSQP